MTYSSDCLELFCMAQVSDLSMFLYSAPILSDVLVGFFYILCLNLGKSSSAAFLINGGKKVLVSAAHADIKCHMLMSIFQCLVLYEMPSGIILQYDMGHRGGLYTSEEAISISHGHHVRFHKISQMVVVLNQWVTESNLNN